MSLVLPSPSTVTMLNVSSTACASACFRNPGSTAASVVKNPSIVAICGWIIPAPFTQPPMVIGTPPISTRAAADLGPRSVVIMLRAKSSPPWWESSTRAIPARTRPIGSSTPMRPVVQTAISSGSTPTRCAANAVVSTASRIPASTTAFAMPLTATTARTCPASTRSCVSTTDLDLTRFSVKTPAAAAGASASRMPTSSLSSA